MACRRKIGVDGDMIADGKICGKPALDQRSALNVGMARYRHQKGRRYFSSARKVSTHNNTPTTNNTGSRVGLRDNKYSLNEPGCRNRRGECGGNRKGCG